LKEGRHGKDLWHLRANAGRMAQVQERRKGAAFRRQVPGCRPGDNPPVAVAQVRKDAG